MADSKTSAEVVVDTSIAPGFLLAVPQMPDPRFEKAVVLMAQHDNEGALGFVINHPSDATLADLVENVEPDLSDAVKAQGIGDQSVLIGGPVQTTSIWVVFRRSDAGEPSEDVICLGEDVLIANSAEILRSYLTGETEGPFLVVLGYAGWDPGQLEAETSIGGWLPIPLDEAVLFDIPLEERWEAALTSMGLTPGAFVMGGAGKA